MNLRPIGGYVQTDDQGRILNSCSLESLGQSWKAALAEVAKTYEEVLGDTFLALYVRGSVAQSRPIDGISDIDCTALVSKRDKKVIAQLRAQLKEVNNQFPFVHGIECILREPDGLLEADLFLLRTQSIFLSGDDTLLEERGYYLGEDCFVHLPDIREELRQVIEELPSARQERRGILIPWTGKRVLRALCEMVIKQTGKCSRDLYYCAEAFLGCYPEKEQLVHDLMSMALDQPLEENRDEREVLKEVMEVFRKGREVVK